MVAEEIERFAEEDARRFAEKKMPGESLKRRRPSESLKRGARRSAKRRRPEEKQKRRQACGCRGRGSTGS